MGFGFWGFGVLGFRGLGFRGFGFCLVFFHGVLETLGLELQGLPGIASVHVLCPRAAVKLPRGEGLCHKLFGWLSKFFSLFGYPEY